MIPVRFVEMTDSWVTLTDLDSNNIPEGIYLILSSLHIYGTKYNIYSIKIETTTYITYRKINEGIYSNTTLKLDSRTHASKRYIDGGRYRIPLLN